MASQVFGCEHGHAHIMGQIEDIVQFVVIIQWSDVD
jgi:hypothetical protein